VEKDYKNFVEVKVTSRLENFKDIASDIEEMTWAHAKEASAMMEIPIGSEEFIEIYNDLSKNYSENTKFLKFFMLTSMLTTKKLLESGIVTLPLEEDQEGSIRDITDKINQITETLLSSYIWLTAGHNSLWPENDELSEEIKMSYMFETDNINLEGEDL